MWRRRGQRGVAAAASRAFEVLAVECQRGRLLARWRAALAFLGIQWCVAHVVHLRDLAVRAGCHLL